jgi:cardiolipin synthase A/B
MRKIFAILTLCFCLLGVLGWSSSPLMASELSRPMDSSPNVLDRTHQKILDQRSGSSTIPGNHIVILDQGPMAYAQWLEALRSARSSIYLQTYLLDNDGMCANLIDMLKYKASQGLCVAVIMTRYAQLGRSPRTYQELKRAGIAVLLVGDIGFPKDKQLGQNSWFDRMREEDRIFKSLPREAPFRQWFQESGHDDLMVDFALHEKMLIVDGKTAIMGGRNVSDSYFFWWQDLDIALTGPVVTAITKTFERNWHEFGGQTLPATAVTNPPFPDGVTVRLTQSRPWAGVYTNLDTLCAAIDMARKRVYISSQYLALPPKLNQALTEAARRGVDVRILTNSLETGQEVNLSLCHYISLNYYEDLLRSGVGIYEYQCPKGQKLKPYYHAKQFIIDGQYLAIGSFNLSIRSAYLESELMLGILDPHLALIQEGKFLEDLEKHTRRIDLETYSKEEQDYRLFMDMARHLEILY